MFKGKGWFGGGLWKPKNPHSLEHLKYLHTLLYKNPVVNENNKGLLVETLRSIAEILIWGDQNDSTVFDFFLEKNMLSFFLKIMKQKCGRYVCIQLLQTLNILFENIRNETSLYYLLSNNHVNSIIVHKFDFSDEEVMAYYISFLKTLSLKLNAHTIHFFYNEHTNDFPLYTEAIKFFNHSESMVRIAVRTLTLNVYKVEDKSMLKFIRDKTAAPYFSNLVWFIGNHVLELDLCVKHDADHRSSNRLSDLVAEHLDHLHYLHDILCLQIDALNDVLTDHLLNRLLVPLYVYSLTQNRLRPVSENDKPHISPVVSLFLLSQVFLIISHRPLVHYLAEIILNEDKCFASEDEAHSHSSSPGQAIRQRGFIAPSESLEQSLGNKDRNFQSSDSDQDLRECEIGTTVIVDEVVAEEDSPNKTNPLAQSELQADAETDPDISELLDSSNITDEEKQRQMLEANRIIPADKNPFQTSESYPEVEFSLDGRPYLEVIFSTLECYDNDYASLFSLCLLYAIGRNEGVSQELLDAVSITTERSKANTRYNQNLVERLIKIISQCCQCNSKVRLATLEMSITLLKQMVYRNGRSHLQDKHLAAVEGAREESTLLLRNFYKSEEIFLDMFEDEHREMRKKPLNVEYLMMDSNILLPPTGTPLTGIEFFKRLPCGEVERARKAIRVFFLLRELSLALRRESETQLPLTDPNNCIQVGEVLDLNNSDLIACTVITKDGHKIRRFLVSDVLQLILVEPDSRKLGWGITKFVGFLQDIEVSGDKDDSRCLHVTVHRPLSSTTPSRIPLLSAKFVFDDHIRCMAAKQRLTKGRLKARQRKMHQIAKLLELPGHIQPCPSPPLHALHQSRQDGHRRFVQPRGFVLDAQSRSRSSLGIGHKPLFITSSKVPGFAAAMSSRDDGASLSQHVTERSSEDVSQKTPSSPARIRRVEDIPLELLSGAHGRRSRGSSPKMRKSHTMIQTSQESECRRSSLQDSRSSSVDFVGPKSLRQAEAPAASLVTPEPFAGSGNLMENLPNPLPCILPPAKLPSSSDSLCSETSSKIHVGEDCLSVPDASTGTPDSFSETSFVENPSEASNGGEMADVCEDGMSERVNEFRDVGSSGAGSHSTKRRPNTQFTVLNV